MWNLVNSTHYKAIRIAACDHRNKINREMLDITCQRSNPKQWSKYSMASLVMKIHRDKKPKYLYETLMRTFYTERRSPGLAKFYDNSKGKIGRQRFGNNLHFLAAIQTDWLDKNMSNDAIRILLKKTFFTYLSHPKCTHPIPPRA